MLKELSTTLTNPITKIINLSISQGMFLSVWKSAVVVPIIKSGNPLFTCNYRPISILPRVSKVAEQIICHLNTSLSALHRKQFDSRANYSIEIDNCFFHWKKSNLYWIKMILSELCFLTSRRHWTLLIIEFSCLASIFLQKHLNGYKHPCWCHCNVCT